MNAVHDAKAPPQKPALSFGQRVKRAASIDFITFGASQFIRLAVNVVLARLLFPEAFGLVASINAVNIGMIMLSDVGLGQAIVQSDRSHDENYLNTAWTMSVMRGALLWVVATALCYPVALLQNMPELTYMLPVGAFAVFISGFRSTSFYLAQRQLNMRPIAMIELSSQIVAAALMITWASISPTPWALVAGAITSALVDVGGTHMLKNGPRNKFHFDRDHAKSIFTFGKWIVGSSALTFVTGEGHKLALGRPLGAAGLGVYHMADQLAASVGRSMNRVIARVIYPALCEVQRDRPQKLGHTYYRTRRVIDLVAQPLLGAMVAGGPLLVQLMYGERYADAGWMLQILCVRSSIYTATTSTQYCLTALGHTRYSFFLNVGRAGWLAAGIPLGYAFYGLPGVIWAVATVEVPALAVVLAAMRKHKVLQPARELLAPALFLGSIALFTLLVNLLEPTILSVASDISELFRAAIAAVKAML